MFRALNKRQSRLTNVYRGRQISVGLVAAPIMALALQLPRQANRNVLITFTFSASPVIASVASDCGINRAISPASASGFSAARCSMISSPRLSRAAPSC